MNLQQINSTGNDVWVFVVTAIVLLGLACALWASSVAYLRFRVRLKENRMDSNKRPDDKYARRSKMTTRNEMHDIPRQTLLERLFCVTSYPSYEDDSSDY